MFNNGNSKAFIASTPKGGYCAPNYRVDDSALWKYAQNIAKKVKLRM